MKKHKLMLITHDLAIGGLQQVVVNICKHINRALIEPSVLCLRKRGPLAPIVEKMGIEVLSLPDEKEVDYLSWYKTGKILKRHNTEIIHTHNTQPFVDGTIGALLSNVKTIIHTDHARDFMKDTKRNLFLEWVMSKFAYKIVGVSDHTIQTLIKYERISPKKTITIMNGIDLDKFNIQINRSKKRAEFDIADDVPVIGLGVRLTEQKGIEFLIKAMPELVLKYPNIILVIAGEGPEENRLKQLSQDIKVDSNIRFIGARGDMPEILKILDIYVLPSLWEGLPMVILEAMAAKCPVLATDVGGNATAIKNGQNGVLVQSQSPSALSNKIVDLLKSPEKCKLLVENALQTVTQKFSAIAMTKKYEKLYLRKR